MRGVPLPAARRGRACHGLLALVALVLTLSSCAPRVVALPSGDGTPFADFQAVHQQLSDACRRVRTLTAELSLSGRAGPDRLRGRVVAGFEAPRSMRLEGVAPFGQPAFILVTGPDLADGEAVLMLPRDQCVLRGARADEVLGALTGVSLDAVQLQALLTGCVRPQPSAASGRVHPGGWASIALDGEATLYLRMTSGAWQLRAARTGDWQVEYDAWLGAFPRRVTLRATSPVAVNVTADVAQVETNVDIDAAAFRVDVPAEARAITLEDLREAGPLRQP